MNAEQLLEHFDRVCDAPDAIPQLRRFILDLAVRGKLVEQDPNDEPAAELLKKIIAEKEHLLNKGSIKQQFVSPDKKKDPVPYSIPLNWLWVRFGDIIIDADAGWSPKSASFPRSGDYWGVLKVSAVTWDKFRPTENKQLISDVLNPEKVQIHVGDFLISRANTSDLVAKCVVVNEEPKNLILSDKIVRLCITNQCNKIFLCFFNNNSESARNYYAEKASGTSHSMKNVTRSVIYDLPIPLPSLAEQHRIVAKVDELMALCDQLEEAQAKREHRRDRLVSASLHRLHQSAASNDYEPALFYLNHLPRLTNRPEHIQQLRQTILNLAVQGKLVEQDSNDEPANILLKLDQKGSHVMEARNTHREIWPWDIPLSWNWFRLESICEQITDGEHATPERIHEHQVPLITAKNVRDGFMDFTYTDWVSYETASKAWERCHPIVGDILLVCVGATTGRLCILRKKKDMVLVRSVALIRPTTTIDVDYLALALSSPLCQSEIWEKVKVTAQPCLYLNRMKSLSIPLPPFAEQHRIVAKVDEIMTLCNQLEFQFDIAYTTHCRLLDSILHDAFT